MALLPTRVSGLSALRSTAAFDPAEPASLIHALYPARPAKRAGFMILEAALATTFRTSTAKVVAFPALAPEFPSAWLDGPAGQ